MRAASVIYSILLGLAVIMPGVSPLAAKDVSIKSGQLTLNANLEQAEDKSLSDGVVLITHGTLAHNRMEVITAMQKLLAERGFNTLAINLSLGIDNRHGMFDCNQPSRHKHTDALDEIAAWVKWLKAQGAGKIWLMGHSRGGSQTAWYAATSAGPETKKVILLAPMTFDAQKSAKSYQKRYGVSLDAVLAKARGLIKAGKGAELMELPGILYCKNARATPEAFLSYHAPDERRNTPYWLPRIKVPVLVIAGTEDNIIGNLVEQVRPLADGKRIKLKVIEDADHFFRDFAAEDAADVIAEFLKD